LFKKNKVNSIQTLIDESMNIRGNMSFSGGLRLDGKLTGNLTIIEGEAGTVIMGEKSKITGNINTHTAIIAGEVKGDICASEYLELHSKAIVKGDIEYKLIEIHAGAKVHGKLIELPEVKKKVIDKEHKKNDGRN
jgi:cytoskeletal protein CcmA (bactofilin family)